MCGAYTFSFNKAEAEGLQVCHSNVNLVGNEVFMWRLILTHNGEVDNQLVL